MTACVVEVGPEAVCGPGSVSLQKVSVALECIDDRLALMDDGVIAVDDLWRDVLGAAADGVDRGVDGSEPIHPGLVEHLPRCGIGQ